MEQTDGEAPAHLVNRIKELESQETHILEKLLENDEAFKRREAELLAEITQLRENQNRSSKETTSTETKDDLIDLVIKQKYDLLVKEHASLEGKFAAAKKELAAKCAEVEQLEAGLNGERSRELNISAAEVALQEEQERSLALSRENEQLRKFEHVYKEVVHTVDEDLMEHTGSDIEQDLLQKIKELKAFEQQQTALRKEIVTQCSHIREDIESEQNAVEAEHASSRVQGKEAELLERLEEMSAELEVFKSHEERKEELEREVARLNQSLEEANATLDITLTELTKKSDEVKALESAVKDNSQRVLSVETMLEQSMTELEKARAMNTSLTEQLEDTNATAEALETMQEQLVGLQEEKKRSMEREQELEVELKQTKEGLEEEVAKFSQLDNLGKARLQAIEQATERYRDLELKHQDLIEAAEEHSKRAETAEKKLERVQLELNEAKTSNQKLEEEIEVLREHAAKLRKDAQGVETALKDKTKELSAELQALKNEAAGKAKTIDELAEVIAGVKDGRQVFDWESLPDQELPPPPYGMESAAIQFILRAWTKNERKIAITNRWCGMVIGGEPIASRKSVTFENLTTEVREGFLKLIVPLLKKRSDVDIHVESRPVISGTCLRLSVQPATM